MDKKIILNRRPNEMSIPSDNKVHSRSLGRTMDLLLPRGPIFRSPFYRAWCYLPLHENNAKHFT